MKKCLIIINSSKSDAELIANNICIFLRDRDVISEKFSYDGLNAQKTGVYLDFSGFDFVITLGGDGTVLFASRNCAPLGIPVFPINLGDFGFLASVQKDCWHKELLLFLEEKSKENIRSLVSAEVLRNGKSIFSGIAMNDILVASKGSSRLINLKVAYNHALLGPFKSNGIIIASPTGSTAYSAAAGGPIIEPSLRALVLTPVSSFSLSARPLVFGENGELTVTVLPSRTDIVLIVDGQEEFLLNTGDVIISKVSECSVRLIGATQEKFYNSLQSKLNWAGGPRA